MEHVNCWCFRGIYKGGLLEDDLHVSAQLGTDFQNFILSFSCLFLLNLFQNFKLK